MNEVCLRRTTSNDPEFIQLVRELDGFLAELNGERDGFYSALNRIEALGTVVVASISGQAVGCGAFRSSEGGSVEIKRMYVQPTSQGQGVGRRVLEELESWALVLGHEVARLETSRRLTAAVGLYVRSGYEAIPNYGPYEDVEDSVCFQKRLPRASTDILSEQICTGFKE